MIDNDEMLIDTMDFLSTNMPISVCVKQKEKGKKENKEQMFTWGEYSFLFDDSEFFCFFHFSEKFQKLNGPPGPDRLMEAALPAKGLKTGRESASVLPLWKSDFSDRGMTPSFPWNSLNAMPKLGPSSNIGPLDPWT